MEDLEMIQVDEEKTSGSSLFDEGREVPRFTMIDYLLMAGLFMRVVVIKIIKFALLVGLLLVALVAIVNYVRSMRYNPFEAPTSMPTSILSAPTTFPTFNLTAPSVSPTHINGTPTSFPTDILTEPTASPTEVVVATPTAVPTLPPFQLYCPPFSTSNTKSATSNYAVCSITACPGDTVLMTTFSPGSCSGDTYLRLYDPSTGKQLARNDDYYGTCSQITYTFYTASCRTYELREGCYSSGSCGGVVYYTGSSAISQSPITIATTMPSTQVPNSVNLTLRPTSSKPTVSRSRKPTVRPSFRSPTSKPTLNPSYRPTRDPTITFTSKPTPRTPIKPTRAPSRRQTTTAPTTSSPTVKPTRVPSRRQTTSTPTTGSPTVKPTRVPSRRPSRAPSM